MKASEFSKAGLFRTKYALGLTLAPTDAAALGTELREALSTLAQWRSDRGKSADMAMFTFVIPQAIEAAARGYISQPHSLDPAFRGITDGIKIEFNIVPASPQQEDGSADKPETPCPKCGQPLRSALAKQCRHCGADWH